MSSQLMTTALIYSHSDSGTNSVHCSIAQQVAPRSHFLMYFQYNEISPVHYIGMHAIVTIRKEITKNNNKLIPD